MIWQNPWALAGIAAVVLPILIHLLGRGHARVQRFPSLRFLEASRLLPTRRTRLHDLLLLAIRIGILTAAAFALAQPLFLTASRKRSLGSSLARAIVIDTSASMQRRTRTGERAVDAARREGRLLADSAQTNIVLETAAPSRVIAGAAAWLSGQPARGEIVVLSDFQPDALTASDLAMVPTTVGVRLARIDVGGAETPIETRARAGDVDVAARVTLAPNRTDVEWTRVSQTTSGGEPSLLAGSAESVRADAAMLAARTVGVPLPLDTSRAVAIVYPQFEDRTELLRTATSLRVPWMTDVVAKLRSDSLLVQAASEVLLSSNADSVAGLVVARTSAGRPVVIAAQDSAHGHERLLLFSLADAGSLSSASLIAAVTRSRSTAAPASELEPAIVGDNTLASWQRAPAERANTSGDGGASDGRAFWIAALLLLALETWMRRVA